MVPNHQPVILWGNQLAKIDRLKVGVDNGTIISQAGERNSSSNQKGSYNAAFGAQPYNNCHIKVNDSSKGW